MTGSSSPEELRASIETTRHELVASVNELRAKASELTDWRSGLARNRQRATIAAVIAGFVAGGGIAAIGGLFRST